MTNLFPYQVEAANHLVSMLRAHGAALDGSDTGTGKTFTACGVIKLLGVPTLAVVPKIAETAWHRAAAHVGTSLSTVGWEMVRTGRTPYGHWEHPLEAHEKTWVCTSCLATFKDHEVLLGAACRNNPDGHTLEERKVRHRYGRFVWSGSVGLLIFDEAHRAGAMKSLNAELVIAAKRQGIPTLALTATPACSPLNMRALGYLLGIHKLDGPCGFYPWSRRLGCRPHPVFKGWAWLVSADRQRQTMERLHKDLFPALGVRVRCGDIPGFPERVVEASLLDLDGAGRIDALYAAMRTALAELHEAKSADVDPDHPLTKLLRARQELELLKVPAVVELANDYLSSGQSVAVFVNFRQTIDELSARLKCDHIIDGTVTGDARQHVIDDFQADEAHCVLVNSKAGGICVSLQDLNGDRSRVGLVMPDPSVVTLRQVFGRLHRQGGKSTAYYRVILAAGTKEEDIHRKFTAKSNNLDALLDSDLMPDEN
jgi:superfamily II DNA or RNA helicase